MQSHRHFTFYTKQRNTEHIVALISKANAQKYKTSTFYYVRKAKCTNSSNANYTRPAGPA